MTRFRTVRFWRASLHGPLAPVSSVDANLEYDGVSYPTTISSHFPEDSFLGINSILPNTFWISALVIHVSSIYEILPKPMEIEKHILLLLVP